MSSNHIISTPAEVDLAAPDIRANPYPLYSQLRYHSPLAKTHQFPMGEMWLVTRYDDVATLLKDSRLVNNPAAAGAKMLAGDSWWVPKTFKIIQQSMLFRDGADHQRLRTLIHLAFTPRRIQQLSQRIHEVVDQLCDAMSTQPSVDLIAHFALPLPLTIITDMLGIPTAARDRFHKLAGDFVESMSSGPFKMVLSLPKGRQLHLFIRELIEERRLHPQDDLLSGLVQAEEAGDRLNNDELVSMVFLLLVAGHETTVNLIANGIAALLIYREQFDLLAGRPALMETAVDELVRFTNPVEQNSPRFAAEPIELHGSVIPRGSIVQMVLASANRDETVFPNANQLDLTRSPNRHVGFGVGAHYCVGAPLARLEGSIALASLIERYPHMRLMVQPNQLQWRPVPNVRGLKTLPLRLT